MTDITKTRVEGVTLSDEMSGSLQGYLTASFDDLVWLLGPPNSSGDEYKVSTRWVLVFKGIPVRLYDYKETSLYETGLMSVSQFRQLPVYQWHVGAKSSTEARAFVAHMQKHLSKIL